MRCALLLLPAVLACDGSAPRTGDLRTDVDTIGDTVVVRTLGAPPPGETRRLVPEKTIGQAEGADERYTFSGIADLVVGPHGQMYVWDGNLLSLRLYDSSGTYVRTISTKGEGPGEHRASNGIALDRAGRLLLWDPRNGRITVFTPPGDLEATWRLDPGSTRGRSLFVDTAGTILLRRLSRDPVTRDSRTSLVRLGPDGAVRDSIEPRVFGPEQPVQTVSTPGRSTTYILPYSPARPWTVSPHGYLVAGPGEPYVVHLLRGDGPTRIEREVERVPVNPDEKSDLRDQMLGILRQVDPGYQWTGPDIPQLKPSYRELTVGDDGRIWVRLSQPSEVVPDSERATPPQVPQGAQAPPRPTRLWREPTVYEVFEPTGEFLGRLAVPRRAHLLRMRGDRAWGVTLDSMDVPYLTRFRIEPKFGSARREP